MNYLLNGWTKDAEGKVAERFTTEYTDYDVALTEYKRLTQDPLTTVNFWVWVENEGWKDARIN